VKKTHDYIHHYRGYWSDGGKCRIRIYREDGQSPVVICSQLPDNDNTSVTNIVEYLAAEIIRERSGALRCPPDLPPADQTDASQLPSDLRPSHNNRSHAATECLFAIAFEIAFESGPPAYGAQVTQLLDGLYDEVATILRRFERHLP
jgi:hypothetical protein